MPITTRTGDDGTTGLLFNRRVPKNHPRIEACGTVDELNATLGMARAGATTPETADILLAAQKSLVGLMAELATDDADFSRLAASKLQRLQPDDLAALDAAALNLEARRVRVGGWDIPGASAHHAHLHFARAVCRRAERAASAVRASGATVPDLVMQFLNRLSDVLWLLASAEEDRANIDSVEK